MKNNVENVNTSNVIDIETSKLIFETKETINTAKNIGSEIIDKKGLQKYKNTLLQGGSGTIGGSIFGSALVAGLGASTILPGFIVGALVVGGIGAIMGSKKDK